MPEHKYTIQISSAAQKQLKKLDPSVGKKVFADIRKLADDPRPNGYEQLKDRGKLYRLPVGPRKDYRVLYEIEDDKLRVLKVADRNDICRSL